MDLVVLGLVLAGSVIFMTMLFWMIPCDSAAGCDATELGSEQWMPMISSCELVFRQIEQQKRNLENRASMMDELIERADRQIEAMHERIAVIGNRRPLTDIEQQMFDLLHAGGFDREEISQFTHRCEDELDSAA